MSLDPLIFAMSHVMVPLPRISVLLPLRPSIDFVSGVPGGLIKSVRTGVTEQEAPVSMPIGRSFGRDEKYTVGEFSGRVCL